MKFKKVLFLAIAVCCLFMMSSCDFISDLFGGFGKEECEHEWQDATCTAPKTCKLCGNTKGDALGHSGGTATCAGAAICTECGEEYGETDASVHTGEEVWFKHLNTHNRGYSCCGAAVTEAEDHAKSGGVCTVCGFDPVISISEAVISSDTGTASLTVSVSDNPGIIGLELTLSFDESITLSDARSGSALASLAFTPPEDISRGGTFLWDGIDIEDKDVKDGDILTLTFDISEATVGEHTVLLNVKACDGDFDVISFKLVNGVISVNG